MDALGRTWINGARLAGVVADLHAEDYNSGGVVADETAKDARTARVVLYHDAEHLSALEIPIIR